mgnify:CR=1 FL=1
MPTLISELNKALAGTHSYVVISNNFNFCCRITDDPTGLEHEAIIDRSPYTDDKVYIGSFCSIAKGVKFFLGLNHNINRVTTYLNPNLLREGKLDHGGMTSSGNIYIEDDVWIGMDAKIMSGVRLGVGCVIATGSIVTKDIEPYTIAAGIPAKPISKRFDEKTIERLVKSRWWELPTSFLNENSDLLYSEEVDKFLDVIETKQKNTI